jgi:hypothetical protein
MQGGATSLSPRDCVATSVLSEDNQLEDNGLTHSYIAIVPPSVGRLMFMLLPPKLFT